jgi:hypothetical protein
LTSSRTLCILSPIGLLSEIEIIDFKWSFMIKLFNDIYLDHATTNDDLVQLLLNEHHDSFWLSLINKKEPFFLKCNSQAFIKLFSYFFSNVLKRGRDSETIQTLLELYENGLLSSIVIFLAHYLRSEISRKILNS